MRARLSSLLLMVASAAAALLLCETIVRLKDGISLFSTDNFVARAIDGVRREGVVVHDERLGWAMAPDQRQRYDGTSTFTTGALGERMPAAQARPTQQGAILTVGDSFTAGAEVSDSETWPAQLEAILGTPVVNAGVLGYGVDQTVLRAEQLVPRLRPSVLLVGVLAVDTFRNHMRVYSGAPKPYFAIEGDSLALRNVPVPRLASTVRDLGLLRSVLGRSYLFHFMMTRLGKLDWWQAGTLGYQTGATEQEALEISCRLMKRLARLRDTYHVRVGVVVLYGGPEALRDEPPWYGPPLVECIEREGLEVVDDFEALKSVRERDGMAAFRRLSVMHDNDRTYGHMSPEGNRLVANLVAARLFGRN